MSAVCPRKSPSTMARTRRPAWRTAALCPGGSVYESITSASISSRSTAATSPTGSNGGGCQGSPRWLSWASAQATPPRSLRNRTPTPRATSSSASATQRTRCPTPVRAPASQRIPTMVMLSRRWHALLALRPRRSPRGSRSCLHERLLQHVRVQLQQVGAVVQPGGQGLEVDRLVAEVVDDRLDQLPVVLGVQGEPQV